MFATHKRAFLLRSEARLHNGRFEEARDDASTAITLGHREGTARQMSLATP